MTIGKLPATGPSPSPTQKTRKPPTTGLASSKQTGLGPRAAKALPAQIRSVPKTISSAIGPNRRSRRAACRDRWLRQDLLGAAGRRIRQSRLRDRRKAVRRQARPRLMRRRPRQTACVRQAGPGAIETRRRARRRPQAARNFWNQQRRNPSASRRRRQQPAPSIGKPAPAPSKPTGRSAPRPQNESAPVPYPRPRATTRAGSRTDSVSERPGGLELEQGGAPVQRVCFDHYRTAHQIAVGKQPSFTSMA